MLPIDSLYKKLEVITEHVSHLFNDNKEHSITLHVSKEEHERLNKAIVLELLKYPQVIVGKTHDSYEFGSLRFQTNITIKFKEHGEETK